MSPESCRGALAARPIDRSGMWARLPPSVQRESRRPSSVWGRADALSRYLRPSTHSNKPQGATVYANGKVRCCSPVGSRWGGVFRGGRRSVRSPQHNTQAQQGAPKTRWEVVLLIIADQPHHRFQILRPPRLTSPFPLRLTLHNPACPLLLPLAPTLHFPLRFHLRLHIER